MTVAKGTIEPPAASELLLLVADFLERELAPAQSDDKLRFRTRVAANLLRIARREWECLEQFEIDADGYAVPPELIAAAGSLRALAEDLYKGRRDLTEPQTFALASRYVEAKLGISAPELLSGREMVARD